MINSKPVIKNISHKNKSKNFNVMKSIEDMQLEVKHYYHCVAIVTAFKLKELLAMFLQLNARMIAMKCNIIVSAFKRINMYV